MFWPGKPFSSGRFRSPTETKNESMSMCMNIGAVVTSSAAGGESVQSSKSSNRSSSAADTSADASRWFATNYKSPMLTMHGLKLYDFPHDNLSEFQPRCKVGRLLLQLFDISFHLDPPSADVVEPRTTVKLTYEVLVACFLKARYTYVP